MSTTNQLHVYNLKAVLRETGLKADVLRAWERRYGLPKPQRSTGGHRLYSDYDIEVIKWLKARQAEGLSISRAVELWKEAYAAGNDPLVYPATGTPLAVSPISFPDSRLDAMCRNWLESGMGFDSDQAEEVLSQAFALYPVEVVCTAILQKGLSNIGTAWYLGQASAQQEHFISALAMRHIETLIAAMPHPTRDITVLVGCPPGEQHTFSAQLLHLFLRRKGMKVVYLGADIPTIQIKETTAALHLDLVVLAAQQLTTAATLRTAALIFQEMGIPLAYGGLTFNREPRLCARIPGYYLGKSLAESVNCIEQLASSPALPSPIAEGVDELYLALARQYHEKRALIEETLLTILETERPDFVNLEEANAFFGDRLIAALDLGDLTFVEPDLEWVTQFLDQRQKSAGLLTPYLNAYSLAVENIMGRASTPITTWITTYVAKLSTYRNRLDLQGRPYGKE